MTTDGSTSPTTTVPAAATPMSPLPTQQATAPALSIQLISPTQTLNWAGFVITPTSCTFDGRQVTATGSVTVPPIPGQVVVGQVEAWVVYENGDLAGGQPSPIPDATGQFQWPVTVPVSSSDQVKDCEVQGIDPNYAFAGDPQ